jgi:hypothetical protein
MLGGMSVLHFWFALVAASRCLSLVWFGSTGFSGVVPFVSWLPVNMGPAVVFRGISHGAWGKVW